MRFFSDHLFDSPRLEHQIPPGLSHHPGIKSPPSSSKKEGRLDNETVGNATDGKMGEVCSKLATLCEQYERPVNIGEKE